MRYAKTTDRFSTWFSFDMVLKLAILVSLTGASLASADIIAVSVPSGGGNVVGTYTDSTNEPDIDCPDGGICTFTGFFGTVTLTATPIANFEQVSWGGTPGCAGTPVGSGCVISLSEAGTTFIATAIFQALDADMDGVPDSS